MERLTNLADILREAGLPVEEVPNWKTTSRNDDKSVYVTGRPTHFMHHHTATRFEAHANHESCRKEASIIQTLEPNEPISNLALCPHGVWFTICAGPSNTNGVGIDTWHPVGDPLKVPDNSMNSYAVANELMNNGIGEPYTPEMQNSLLVGTAAICIELGISVFENRAHFEWAPTRKIDVAGPSRWTNVSDKNLKWDMGKFRTDLQAEILRQLTPALPKLEDGMNNIVLRCKESAAYVAWDGTLAVPIESLEVWNIGKFVGLYPVEEFPPVIAKKDLQAIINNFAPVEKRITL